MLEKPGKAHKNKGQSEWLKTRRIWFRTHPADYRGMWQCQDCGNWTPHIELDHILRRGSHAELINEQSNLRPLCHLCHSKRDSGMKIK